VRGGMLCEEMGMGKTAELVALIWASRDAAHERERRAIEPVPWKPSVVLECAATLVVAPNTLVAQWVREIAKTCKPDAQLRVAVWIPSDAPATFPSGATVWGSSSASARADAHQFVSEVRAAAREAGGDAAVAALPPDVALESVLIHDRELVRLALSHDVVLTTYAAVQRELKLERVHWRRVVVDELQEIRSSATRVAEMCEVRRVSAGAAPLRQLTPPRA